MDDTIDAFDIYEAKKADLDADLASGLISEAEHARAVALIDRWLDDYDRVL